MIKYLCFVCHKELKMETEELGDFNRAANEVGRKYCDRCGSNKDNLYFYEEDTFYKITQQDYGRIIFLVDLPGYIFDKYQKFLEKNNPEEKIDNEIILNYILTNNKGNKEITITPVKNYFLGSENYATIDTELGTEKLKCGLTK